MKTCSWLYHCQKILKLPRTENEGATLGDVTHQILELLGRADRKAYVDRILSTRKITRGIIRLVRSKLQKTPYYSKENLKKILTWVGRFLKYDFHFAGATKVLLPEFSFDIKNSRWWVRGFLDRAAIYDSPEGKYVVIRDAKTQKERFTANEMEMSLQALLYLLAIKHLHPEINVSKSRVEFVMLKFPEDPLQVVENVDEDMLEGVEMLLKEWQVKADNFDEKAAKANLAANKGWPKPGEAFGGLAKCGYAKFAGQMKKDGSKPYYHCEAKFPFEYFSLVDKDGKVLTSSKDESTLTPKESEKVIARSYAGCPAHCKSNYR